MMTRELMRMIPSKLSPSARMRVASAPRSRMVVIAQGVCEVIIPGVQGVGRRIHRHQSLWLTAHNRSCRLRICSIRPHWVAHQANLHLMIQILISAHPTDLYPHCPHLVVIGADWAAMVVEKGVRMVVMVAEKIEVVAVVARNGSGLAGVSLVTI